MWKLAVFFIIINALSLTMMYMDKYYAKSSRRRIPESKLMTVAIFGGSLGAFMGMNLFRHKTKHPKFKYGLPAIMVLHFALFLLICLQLNGIDVSGFFKVA
ncbi:hypothetical protein EUAN_00990 [Andreesenia angusta]|uniref:DUF1294 domain-containing protein n=1 Tax=Andreesenia angusta TaxID=39480 RepID=A0A1S1V9Y4_9FIRM|nr:DUF1294 domain-containing protein [Andreesenia angusta]OHW63235.1 hypothetical protein EUAN_00990 [Andreesenia angusta]